VEFHAGNGCAPLLWRTRVAAPDVAPVILLIGADLWLDKYYSYPFSWDLFFTWGWYAAMLWMGTALRENAKGLCALGCSG